MRSRARAASRRAASDPNPAWLAAGDSGGCAPPTMGLRSLLCRCNTRDASGTERFRID